ncbi:hypothetical protein BaRGS_00014509 [Batillaria attramentaria]|uniref:Uncharacterized protein n=1 Tax=Batillaria attramentaria TaxID=370345 RepID=A0ABD0L4H2_9CAEN
MALVLKNLQNVVRLNLVQIEKDVRILRRLFEIERFDVSFLFVTNDYIARLNQEYRQVEGPTDVLAFPALEIAVPGVFPIDGEDDGHELDLGDVCLAPAYIQQQCWLHNDSFNDVLMATAAHGLCHLIGHDHETETQWQRMVETERDILSRFNKLTGHNSRPLTGVGH